MLTLFMTMYGEDYTTNLSKLLSFMETCVCWRTVKYIEKQNAYWDFALVLKDYYLLSTVKNGNPFNNVQ